MSVDLGVREGRGRYRLGTVGMSEYEYSRESEAV